MSFSALAWLIAIGAGVFETVVAVIEAWRSGSLGFGVYTGVGVRLAAFALALIAVAAMVEGSRAARALPTIGLGVVGLASIMVGPVGWIAGGHTLGEALAVRSGFSWAFAVSRGVHVAAVASAVVAMYLPDAREYFSRPLR